MKKSAKIYRTVLRILGSLALLGYILFFIGEGVSVLNFSSFEYISVFLLFIVFLTGYFYLWKNELISGMIWILFYLLQWCLVLWVWYDGDLTIILSFPIFVLGILLLIYGIRNKQL